MNPCDILENVQADYLTYVRIFQRFHNPRIRDWVMDRIEHGTLLWKAPYILLSRRFAHGETLESLVDAGLLHPGVLPLFRRNLTLSLDDDRRRFIFNVAGQGSVGKAWLLCRFRDSIPTAAMMKCNRASAQSKDQLVPPKYWRTYLANPARSNHVSGIGTR